MKKILILGLLLFMSWEQVFACAVCFGDPNSPLTHGARAAVWVLLGVITFVLLAIAGVAMYWVRRARLLEVQAALRGEKLQL